MSSVILKTQQSEDKTAPLKLTIPESWAGAPCSKLLKAWSKRKQCTGEVYLASNDGTPIPEDWPWEAAVELYGSTLRVGERRDADDDDAAKRCDDDAATNARAAALLRRGAFDEAERAFRRVLEGGAAALGDASAAAGDAATAAAEGLDATTACAADVATAKRELLRADGTDDATEITRRLERALAAARVAKQTAPESAEIKKLEAAALCRLKRWPEAAAALGGDEVDAPKGAVPNTIDRRDALDLLKAICYGGDAARAARVASTWAAQFYKSRDWCASQARRYKSVAELKDKGDAAFRAGDARAAERWYAAALDEDPEHPALHYNAAACLEKLGRPLDAARCCASALRCRPDYAAARLRRARCLARGAAADGDRGANAKAYLEAALDEYARCPDAAAEQAACRKRLAFCNTADPEADAAAARAYAARARAQQAPPPPPKPKVVGPTLYDVVGAPRDASPSTLKRAYRARALRMHPDKSKAPDAEDRFRELQAAYDVLSDARERAAYDRETFFGAV